MRSLQKKIVRFHLNAVTMLSEQINPINIYNLQINKYLCD